MRTKESWDAAVIRMVFGLGAGFGGVITALLILAIVIVLKA